MSQDVDPLDIQNEINLYADTKSHSYTIGRSKDADIRMKLKAISSNHCSISYDKHIGWFLSEKDKPSQNGTYVFLKQLK